VHSRNVSNGSQANKKNKHYTRWQKLILCQWSQPRRRMSYTIEELHKLETWAELQANMYVHNGSRTLHHCLWLTVVSRIAARVAGSNSSCCLSYCCCWKLWCMATVSCQHLHMGICCQFSGNSNNTRASQTVVCTEVRNLHASANQQRAHHANQWQCIIWWNI